MKRMATYRTELNRLEGKAMLNIAIIGMYLVVAIPFNAITIISAILE